MQHMSPEVRAKLRAIEDEALARGERLWWVCRQCGRDFTANHRERFCLGRCLKRHKLATASAAFSLPPVTTEEDLFEAEAAEAVYDPRAGRYGTTSWSKWAMPR